MDAILLVGVIVILVGGFAWIVTAPRQVSTLQNPEPVTAKPDGIGKSLVAGIGASVLVLLVLFGLAFALARVTP